MGRIQASDFEIVEVITDDLTDFSVLFRGRQIVIAADRQIAELYRDFHLKCELRFEEIRDEAAEAPAAEHNNQHVTPHSNTGDDQP